MKKYVFLLALTLGVIVTNSASAQRTTTIPLAVGDTVEDAGTASKIFNLTGKYNGVTIKAKVDRLSGTAAGTVVLYESMGDSDYKSTGDTLTLTNTASQYVYWHKSVASGNGTTGGLNKRYKITLTGSGTVTEVLSVAYTPWEN